MSKLSPAKSSRKGGTKAPMKTPKKGRRKLAAVYPGTDIDVKIGDQYLSLMSDGTPYPYGTVTSFRVDDGGALHLTLAGVDDKGKPYKDVPVVVREDAVYDDDYFVWTPELGSRFPMALLAKRQRAILKYEDRIPPTLTYTDPDQGHGQWVKYKCAIYVPRDSKRATVHWEWAHQAMDEDNWDREWHATGGDGSAKAPSELPEINEDWAAWIRSVAQTLPLGLRRFQVGMPDLDAFAYLDDAYGTTEHEEEYLKGVLYDVYTFYVFIPIWADDSYEGRKAGRQYQLAREMRFWPDSPPAFPTR